MEIMFVFPYWIISASGKRNLRITDDNNSSAWNPPE